MSLKPLFPPSNQTVTIQQGKTGDCYILAVVDCVANKLPQGREKLQSLFTQSATGVTLRIKRTELSENLQSRLSILKSRYGYVHDKTSNEDVFVISNEVLKEIQSTPFGVSSNSLMVYILEHISAYYFANSWTPTDELPSARAHNTRERHGMNEAAFTSMLLGVERAELDIDEVIKFKKLFPNLPVYIGMDWDLTGTSIHTGHALRVDKITPRTDSTNKFKFELINPWNNSDAPKIEDSEHIKQSRPDFSIFALTKEDMEFSKILLELSEEDAKLVLTDPTLEAFLKGLKTAKITHFDEAVKLYKAMPNVAKIFSILKTTNDKELKIFKSCLRGSNGDKSSFLSAMLSWNERDEVVFALLKEGIPANSVNLMLSLAIRGKCPERYALMCSHNVNIFGQLLFTRLDKEQFLKSVIELELHQKKPNKKLLKVIDEYVTLYNEQHQSAPLKIRIDAALINSVELSDEEVDLLKAQMVVIATLDNIRNFPLVFTDQVNINGLYKRRDALIAHVKTLDGEPVSIALQHLGGLEKAKVSETIQEKLDRIDALTKEQGRLIKLMEETLAKQMQLFNFPISFATSFDETHLHNTHLSFLKKLEARVVIPQELTTNVKLATEIQRSIDAAIKAKTVFMETEKQKRAETIRQAEEIISSTVKRITEFVPTFPGLNVHELGLQRLVQLKQLTDLSNFTLTLRAQELLGYKSMRHPRIQAALTNKVGELQDALEDRKELLADAGKKVSTYMSSIKLVSSDFSRAETESDIEEISEHLIKKLAELETQISQDKTMELVPTTTKELLMSAIKARGQSVVAFGLAAHNDLIKAPSLKKLANSNFEIHFASVKNLRLANWEMIHKLNSAKHKQWEQPSNTLYDTLAKALNEFHASNGEKLTASRMDEKMKALLSKAKVAVTAAKKSTLTTHDKWNVLLGELDKSLQSMEGVGVNRHSFHFPKIPSAASIETPCSTRGVAAPG
jgi:hypothetical protein